MNEDNTHVSKEIMETYYANSFFPSDAELRELGIDPSHVYHIDNGPGVPLSAFLAQVEQAVNDILKREVRGHETS